MKIGYHNRYYNIVMPFTKLFNTDRKNTYLGLQKDACSSKYRRFQTKSKSIIKRKNYFASKNEDLDTFYKKWTKNFPL